MGIQRSKYLLLTELSQFALNLSTCVAPLFHLISFVSTKYTVGGGGGGGGDTKVCFCGYVPPGSPKKHAVFERINIQNFYHPFLAADNLKLLQVENTKPHLSRSHL